MADVCAACAPRPIVLAGSVNEHNQRLDQMGESDAAFARAVRGYTLCGAADRLVASPAGDMAAVASGVKQALRD